MASSERQGMAYGLKRASRGGAAPIWLRLSRLALKPSRARRVVNLKRIAALTKEGDVVAVPGKVLGTGGIGHPITLCSFSVSRAAAGKIARAGGSVASFGEVAAANPDGTGVRIIG